MRFAGGCTVGPQSVEYRVKEDSVSFGGQQLTCTDLALASGIFHMDEAHHVDEVRRRFTEEQIQVDLRNRELSITPQHRTRRCTCPLPVHSTTFCFSLGPSLSLSLSIALGLGMASGTGPKRGTGPGHGLLSAYPQKSSGTDTPCPARCLLPCNAACLPWDPTCINLHQPSFVLPQGQRQGDYGENIWGRSELSQGPSGVLQVRAKDDTVPGKFKTGIREIMPLFVFGQLASVIFWFCQLEFATLCACPSAAVVPHFCTQNRTSPRFCPKTAGVPFFTVFFWSKTAEWVTIWCNFYSETARAGVLGQNSRADPQNVF